MRSRHSTDTVSEFDAEEHRQLRVKDLHKVLTWRLDYKYLLGLLFRRVSWRSRHMPIVSLFATLGWNRLSLWKFIWETWDCPRWKLWHCLCKWTAEEVWSWRHEQHLFRSAFLWMERMTFKTTKPFKLNHFWYHDKVRKLLWSRYNDISYLLSQTKKLITNLSWLFFVYLHLSNTAPN